MEFGFLFEENTLKSLGQGMWVTVWMTAVSLFISFVIGLFIGMARLSRNTILRWFSNAYVAWFRGTPLLVQLMLIYYGLAIGLKVELTATVAGLLGLGMYSGAYVSEIVRGAIVSVEKGMAEAGRSLGLSRAQTMRKIIIPIAFRRMLPPLGNESIALTKNSSLLSVITVTELMKAGNSIVAYNFRYFEMFLAIAVMYFVLNYLISKGVTWLEKRLHVGGAR